MRAGRDLLVGWLLAVLVLPGVDGRLPLLAAWAVPGSLLAVASARSSASSGGRPC